MEYETFYVWYNFDFEMTFVVESFHLLCFISLNLWLIQGQCSVDRQVTDAGNGLLFLVGGGKLDN